MSPPKLKEVNVSLPRKFDTPDEPWYRYITVDLLHYVLGYTVFHPFVACVLVLCLRAQYTPWHALEMRIAIAWAMLMCTIGIFNIISDRIAYGAPREVDLSEEVIVITGGVDGLGGLLAETYGMRNANVAVLDMKKVDDEEAEEKGVFYYQCDVGDAKQVEAAVAEIVEDLGAPTILVNNAGMVRAGSILDSTPEEVEQTFRTNTISHFNTLRAVLPHMLSERRGTIVTVSSVLGRLGAANLSSYTASKAALLALHQSLRAELAQNPDANEIKTILVTPGQMGTKMFQGVKTPSKFLGPVVSLAEVAKSIMNLIEKGESGEVALPLYTKYAGTLDALPVGIQALLRRWSAMDTAIQKSGMVSKSEMKEQ
ncbi:hypothetical protein SLS60_006833 [Paraconiothyrium brasiliense]|uniref:Ketoreductase domain-containing protein n=1 Tax=Paraconiothyrium brasiliense TaxID=300254 RepID=A0ABR3R900_9PLEO